MRGLSQRSLLLMPLAPAVFQALVTDVSVCCLRPGSARSELGFWRDCRTKEQRARHRSSLFLLHLTCCREPQQ